MPCKNNFVFVCESVGPCQCGEFPSLTKNIPPKLVNLMKNLLNIASWHSFTKVNWVSPTNSLASLAFSWKSKLNKNQVDKSKLVKKKMWMPWGFWGDKFLRFAMRCQRWVNLLPSWKRSHIPSQPALLSRWFSRVPLWRDMYSFPGWRKFHPDESPSKPFPQNLGRIPAAKLKPFGTWCLYTSFIKIHSWMLGEGMLFVSALRKVSRMISASWTLKNHGFYNMNSHHMMDSHLRRFLKDWWLSPNIFLEASIRRPDLVLELFCEPFTRENGHPKRLWMLINKAQPMIFFAVSQPKFWDTDCSNQQRSWDSWVMTTQRSDFSISSFCPWLHGSVEYTPGSFFPASLPLKNDAWKTILSFGGPANLQGRAVKPRWGIPWNETTNNIGGIPCST